MLFLLIFFDLYFGDGGSGGGGGGDISDFLKYKFLDLFIICFFIYI